jgi:hypothetical protein
MADYFDVIREVDALIAELQRHPDPETRAQAEALLGGLDALHREGLGRLIAALHTGGAGDLVEEAARADPVIGVLLGLYDLVPLALPPEPAGAHGGMPAGVTGFVPIERLTVRKRDAAS